MAHLWTRGEQYTWNGPATGPVLLSRPSVSAANRERLSSCGSRKGMLGLGHRVV